MGILTPLLLIFNSRLPKIGIQNPLLRCALVLGIGVVSFMLGSVINSRIVEGLDPLTLPRSIELETELLFPALK
jgi:hypothetical protein